MLDIVAAAHPHNRIIVDAEAEDPAASNNEQRIRRMAFYARNGYCRSGIAYIGAGFRTRYSFGAEPSPSRNSKAFGTTSMRRNARKCENSGAPGQSAVPDGQLNLRKENAKACDAH